jgi:hypothetical protein
MTDPQSVNSSEQHATAGPADQPQPPATPRWVKVAGAVIAVLVLAAVAKVLFGGGVGEHGPGLHGGLGAPTPPASSSEARAPVRALPGL